MNNRSFLRITGAQLARAVVFTLALVALPHGFGQGITTAALSGFVTDGQGKPVAGATVTAMNTQTGTRTVATTRSTGQYNFPSLQIGGPYTVSTTLAGQQPITRNDVFLSPGQEEAVDLKTSSDVTTMAAMTVNESNDTTFGAEKMGTATNYNAEAIANLPTVRRDIQDIANTDPRISLTINTSTGEFSVSAQGQNSRYNSFLIDGVQSNDTFGLNANGFSSTRSPIPLDALAAVSIELNPFDVTRSGFTGALINAVTKSGTNEFHGSVYTYYMGKSIRGEYPGTGPTDPYKGQKDAYQDHTTGLTFGGPILKDKLFFFLAFEDYRKTAAPTTAQQIFRPDDAAVAAVAAAAKVWGYDIGSVNGALTKAAQKSYLAKLDWNINDSQRATLTYLRVAGNFANPADYAGSTFTSSSTHWYQSNRITDKFNLQLNSTWTPDFSTEASAAFVKYNGTALPNGTPFPEIYVNGVSGTNLVTGAAVANGQIDLGTNFSYQYNSLYTKEYNGHLYGVYSFGNNTIKFGGDSDKTDVLDKFVQYYYGRYAFASAADFAAGNASYLQYQQSAPGFNIDASNGYYSFADFGALIQDTWKPNSQFTLVGGLRFDYPYIPGRPLYLASFQNTWGFRNDTTGSGNYRFAPRLGFKYSLATKRLTQIRGGIGLFQGTSPAVWVANAFDTNGSLNTVVKGNSTTNVSPAPGAIAVFNPTPTYVQTLPTPAAPTPNINVTDPNFSTPASWKANIAIDHTLPWFGLIATAEADFTRVEKAIYLQSLNLVKVGTLPDGRDQYSGKVHSAFAAVIRLTDTNKGGGEAYTVGLNRPMKDHWAFSAGYTHIHATEVQPLTSSVATSSYNNRATINPNEDVARRSIYSTPDKYVASATREFDFFKTAHAKTRISGIFRAQTGHAYSWTFASDVNGDGTNGNDAFYVPTGPSDPKVTWADPAQQAAFFDFVSHSQLKNYMGRIVPPESAYNPFQKTLDVHFEQEIPLYKQTRLSLYVDCLNFANLFNKSWGVVNGLDFGTGSSAYNRRVAGGTYNAATGTYAYTFSSSTLSSQPTFTELSRWQLQLGAKLAF
jgi:Carboxypeptidase regulatory-like domain